MYIYHTQRGFVNSGDELPSGTLMMLKSGGSMTDLGEYGKKHLTPAFIGYNLDGSATGVYANAEAARDLYGSLSEILACVLGSGYECRIQEPDSGERLWNNCVRNSSYLYIRYHGSLPHHAIYALASGAKAAGRSQSASGDIVCISELFLLPQETAEGTYIFSAVSRSSDGVIAVFEGKVKGEEPDFNLSEIMAYDGNRYFQHYDFLTNYKGTGSDNAFSYPLMYTADDQRHYVITLRGTTVILEEDTASYPITITGKHPSDSASYTEILRVLQYNPDKLNSYTENDGTVICIDDRGNTRLTTDSRVIYTDTGEQDGILLSDFLGYESYSGQYNLCEQLRATERALEELSNRAGNVFGGEANAILFDMYSGGETVTVRYAYAYDNIMLTDETGNPIYAASFTMNGQRMLRIELCLLTVEAGETRVKNLPQRWTYEKLCAMNTITQTDGETGSAVIRTQGDLCMRYVIDPVILMEETPAEVMASWLVCLNRTEEGI